MKTFAQEITTNLLTIKPIPPNNDNSWQLISVTKGDRVEIRCDPYWFIGKRIDTKMVYEVTCFWQREEQ
jgi:hypothetical protein